MTLPGEAQILICVFTAYLSKSARYNLHTPLGLHKQRSSFDAQVLFFK